MSKNHYFHPIHSYNLSGPIPTEYVSSIDLRLTNEIMRGIPLGCLFQDIMENLAFQTQNFITESKWEDGPLSIVVSVGVVHQSLAHTSMSRHQSEYEEYLTQKSQSEA